VFAPLPSLPSAFEDVTLRLDLMRGGQVRAVRVPLAVVREGRLSPCGSTLHVRVYCREPANSYQLDIKADFGPQPPRSARLTVFSGDSPVGPAVSLVSGGEYREPELPLDLEVPCEQLVFRVALNPAGGAALELVGVARLGQVGEGEVRRETQSSRLRAARAALKTDLADALLHAPVPALAVLGRLIEAEELTEKMELLRRLFETQLDIRLIEAAVRDIEVTARMEKSFTDVEFAALSLSDPVEASIVLFHPRSPTYLLAVCFVLCLEQNLAPANEREGQWWRQMAKAGAVALWRRDRSSLEELQGTMRASEDPVKAVLLEKLAKWAARRETTLPPEPKDPFEDRLARIRGESPDAAMAAALEALIYVGYLSVTRDLGPGAV